METTKKLYKALLEQLDLKIKPLRSAAMMGIPSGGWIHTTRTALRMTQKELANRLGIHPNGIKQMQKGELEGTTSLKRMKAVAKAMEMEFVYFFVPLTGSTMEEHLHQRALKVSRRNMPHAPERQVDRGAEHLKEKPQARLWEKEL
jgi:predicted DNA-binding mobile mystery protein A